MRQLQPLTPCTVLFLRCKLQKGLLSKEHAPLDGDMADMSKYMTQLETHPSLDEGIIMSTKIHKVLKEIRKLGHISNDEQHKLKLRAGKLLLDWNLPTYTSKLPKVGGLKGLERKPN